MDGSGHVAPRSDLDIVNSTWPRQKGVEASSPLRGRRKLTSSFCATVLIYQ